MARAQSFLSALSAALQSDEFHKAGGYVAFACKHWYENNQLPTDPPSPLPKATSPTQPALKGGDALIAMAATALDIPVSAVYVVKEECADENWLFATYPAAIESRTYKEWIEDSFKAKAITDDDFGDMTIDEGDLEGLH